jgi:hypothetical protein
VRSGSTDRGQNGNGVVHDTFLSADVCVMTNSTHAEGTVGTESSKLSATGSQGGKRWGGISDVGDNQILDVGGEAIVVLIY